MAIGLSYLTLASHTSRVPREAVPEMKPRFGATMYYLHEVSLRRQFKHQRACVGYPGGYWSPPRRSRVLTLTSSCELTTPMGMCNADTKCYKQNDHRLHVAQIKVDDLHRSPVHQEHTEHPILREPIPVEQRLPRAARRRLPHRLPVAEVARGGAPEDAQRGRVRRVRREEQQQRVRGGARRRDGLAALPDHGRRARHVVRAVERGRERERGARPVRGRAPPVVVPAVGARGGQ